IPYLPHLRTDTSGSRFWPAVVDRVLRRPVVSCAVAAAVLVALAVPALRLHVAKPSDEALAPQNVRALRAFSDIRRDFPGASEPARVVATVRAGDESALRRRMARLRRLSFASGLAHPPAELTTSSDGTGAALALPLTGAGDNGASRRAIATLRDQLVPQTIGRIPRATPAGTGEAAEGVDFTPQVKRGEP